MPTGTPRTLSETSEFLEHCPVLVINDDGSDFRRCGQPIRVVHTQWVTGDDYGAWTDHAIFLGCGHTLAEMQSSLRMEEHL